MNTQLTLNVSPRAQTGRSASRRLRKVNRIPAILYGKHTEPGEDRDRGPGIHEAPEGRGRPLGPDRAQPHGPRRTRPLSFLQEMQRDPITDQYLHVDLHEVKPDEKFEIRVPVHVIGESFGVKNQSGVLEIATHALRIRCLPKDLPAVIEVDVTELKVGETIKVGELKPIPGVEFLDHKGQPVVSCVEPVAEIVVEVPVAAEARRPGRGRGRPGRGCRGSRRGQPRAARGRREGRSRRRRRQARRCSRRQAGAAAGAKPAAAAGAKPGAARREAGRRTRTRRGRKPAAGKPSAFGKK